MNDPVKSAIIRDLNDQLRNSLATGKIAGGKIMVTPGINAMPLERQARVFAAVQAFNDFTDENDPWKEHDLGVVVIDGERIFFKFDYMDPTMSYASDDPSDTTITVCVLTIMLADEY